MLESILGDYTVFKNIQNSPYLFWFNSLLSQQFSASIWWKLPENSQRKIVKVTRKRPFSLSCRFIKTSMRVFCFQQLWKDDFGNNVLLYILCLVESSFIEIRVLLPATLKKQLPLVRFMVVSRKYTFQRCIQTQSNI